MVSYTGGMMRDLERLQDVVEYRVSPGQLRLAFLGVLAVACAIFAVGVSVGKRIEPSMSAVSVDPLAELDRATRPASSASESAEEDEEERAPALTYHDELTNPSNTARRAEEARTEEPSTAGRAERERQRAAAARDENVQEEPARLETPQPGESSVYTLQVASFETREEAQAFASDLRGRGHNVFLVRTSTPERGTWFRVRVGPFSSRGEATRYQARFERQERLPTFLVQRRS
jgi:cell division septation protein DedD